MNYNKIYENIVNRAKNRKLDCYTESHHILPRCMGGTDDISNLVDLTPEEHYVAHQLLVKIYPENSKLLYAAQMMTQCSNGKRINNKLFGWIKRKISEDKKLNNSSKDEYVREKISNSLKGNIPWNKGIKGEQVAWNKGLLHRDETKEKLKNAWIERKKNGDKGTFFGKHHTEETKRKLRDINLGKKGTPSSRKGKSLSKETKEKMKLSQKLRREREYNEKNN